MADPDLDMVSRGATEFGSMCAFAHGTSLAYAAHILQSGLNAEAARSAALGERAARPGAFFAHEIGPPEHPGEGLQLAFEWGLRHTSQPVVLIGELFPSIVIELVSLGVVLHEPVPGAEAGTPWQTIFLPASFDRVNLHIRWQLINV